MRSSWVCDGGPVTFGWRYEFREREWSDVRTFLSEVTWRDNEGDYLFDIIDSVFAAHADKALAVTTSMHDLVIAPRPAADPPLDVVLVAAPGSVRGHADGTVRIDHIAVNGANTEIERPAEEAVALFWKFLEIEFGIVRLDGNRRTSETKAKPRS